MVRELLEERDPAAHARRRARQVPDPGQGVGDGIGRPRAGQREPGGRPHLAAEHGEELKGLEDEALEITPGGIELGRPREEGS